MDRGYLALRLGVWLVGVAAGLVMTLTSDEPVGLVLGVLVLGVSVIYFAGTTLEVIRAHGKR